MRIVFFINNLFYIRSRYKLVINNKYFFMPYRRLPNTDAARMRAMKTALRKGEEVPPHKLAFSSKLLVELRKIFTVFENNSNHYKHCLNIQNSKSKEYSETLCKARIYLTHFVRVMNMAITRGDYPAEIRTYYGISVNDSTVPPLISENEIINWGKKIIEGEETRIIKGGSPITNPTIAVVKVWYENFLQASHDNNAQAKKISDIVEKNNIVRKEVDKIISEIWNDVEKTHAAYLDDARKALNEEYGLVYFYRKQEFEKTEYSTLVS